MLLRRARLVVLCLGFLAIAVIAAGIAWTSYTCEQAKTPPSAPIYPASTLISEDIALGLGDFPHVTKHYSSTDITENVIAFYAKQSSCYKGDDDSTVCTNSAVPFGRYSVYISKNSYSPSQLATFTVELAWRGCGR